MLIQKLHINEINQFQADSHVNPRSFAVVLISSGTVCICFDDNYLVKRDDINSFQLFVHKCSSLIKVK